jgi:hypothetical protein
VQTKVHVLPTPNNFWVAIRATFFVVQLGCMAAMGALVVLHAPSS